MKKRNYSGYKILNREFVLSQLENFGYPPAYKNVILEHITYQYPDKEVAPDVSEVFVWGHMQKNGVQCVLVSVDEKIRRPRGGYFHITYSLDDGHKPVESNLLIEELGVENADSVPPIILNVEPF